MMVGVKGFTNTKKTFLEIIRATAATVEYLCDKHFNLCKSAA